MGAENLLGSAAMGFATGGPIGLAASLLPNVIGLIAGGKQKRQAREAAEQAQQRFNQAEGFASQGLNSAQSLYNQSKQQYNGRMAGAGNLEQSIYGNQANTLSSMGRNATSASQLLALAGGVQGNTNDAFGNLAQMEAQDKQARFGQMAYANQGLQAAQQNLQNLYAQQSQQAQNSANQLGQAGATNQFNALQGIGNAAMTFLPGMIGNNSNPYAPQTQALGSGAIQPSQFNMWGGMTPPAINYTLPGIRK